MDRIPEKQDEILQAVFKAGNELIKQGIISKNTQDIISQPLVPEERLRGMFNEIWEKTKAPRID